MPTDFDFILSDRANREIDATLAKIEERWDRKTSNKFFVELIERIHLITKHPSAFRKSEKFHGVRRSVLSKRTIIYYEVDSQERIIKILSVFNTNQDPNSFSPKG